MSFHNIRAAAKLPAQLAAAAITVMAAALPAVASADAPDAHYYFGTPTGFSVLPPSLPEVGAGVYFFTPDGHASGEIHLSPTPTVQLSLTSPTFVGEAVEYAFSITGPGFGAGDFVDGQLTTTMSASGGGAYIAAGALVATGINRRDGTPLALDADTAVCSSSLGYCPDTFGQDLDHHAFDVSFASSGTIEIAAAGKLISGFANILVDPIFTLPEGYTLTLSAGVGNGAPVVPPISAVPEPTTVASMGLGLALLGLVRRRKRDSRGAVAAA